MGIHRTTTGRYTELKQKDGEGFRQNKEAHVTEVGSCRGNQHEAGKINDSGGGGGSGV